MLSYWPAQPAEAWLKEREKRSTSARWTAELGANSADAADSCGFGDARAESYGMLAPFTQASPTDYVQNMRPD